MRLDQRVGLLPHEQVEHEVAQFGHVFADVGAEDGTGVVGRGDAVGGVGAGGEFVDDAVFEGGDMEGLCCVI